MKMSQHMHKYHIDIVRLTPVMFGLVHSMIVQSVIAICLGAVSSACFTKCRMC